MHCLHFPSLCDICICLLDLRLWDENRGAPLGGIVSFEIEGVHPQGVTEMLRKRRVMVDVPSRTLLGDTEHPRPLTVRAAPHYFNLETEVETFVKCILDISRGRNGNRLKNMEN